MIDVRRRDLLTEAVRRLAEAGVASPEADAETLLAHVLGTDRGRLVLVDDVGDEQAQAYDALVARRAAREPLQHLTGKALLPPRRAGRRARASSCRDPRPSCSPAGRSSRRVRSTSQWSSTSAPARAPSPRPSPTRCPPRGCTRSRWTIAPTATRRSTSPAPASTCGSETWAPRSTTWPARSTSSSATRRTSRSRPGSRWPSRPVTTTRPSRCGAATTASTRSAWSRCGQPCCSRPVAWSASSTPTCRGSPRRRCSRPLGRWADVRDHVDLAGRPRFVTARLAR